MPFYTPPKEVNTFDRRFMDAVPVIASFNPDGGVKPLYVRLKDQPLKIMNCYARPFMLYTDYHCSVDNLGDSVDIILTYHLKDNVWTVRY